MANNVCVDFATLAAGAGRQIAIPCYRHNHTANSPN